MKLTERRRTSALNLTLTALFRWLLQRGAQRRETHAGKLNLHSEWKTKIRELSHWSLTSFATHLKVTRLCGPRLIRGIGGEAGFCYYGQVPGARWTRCCLVERKGSLRQQRRPPASTTECGRSADKHDLQKGHFPPGFSSWAWQRSEPVSLIPPPGQSAWHPLQMVVNRGVSREIRRRAMTDSWLHILWQGPILPHLLLPSYAGSGHGDRMPSPVFVLRWGDELFIGKKEMTR